MRKLTTRIAAATAIAALSVGFVAVTADTADAGRTKVKVSDGRTFDGRTFGRV